ncbi:MAG: POTRA domain-containing protein, partial [Rhodospirillaceae bacterium]
MAAVQPNFTIKLTGVDVEGAQRIELDTIRSYLLIKPGDEITPQKLDQSLKRIFATGLFADVSLKQVGTRILVNVIENPVINRISFEGNKRIEDSVLVPEVQLKPRIVYTRSKVQDDLQRLIDIYRRSGRFGVSIEPK